MIPQPVIGIQDGAQHVVNTDGPYAETKEALTGFYLLDCADLDEALAWAAQVPAAPAVRRAQAAAAWAEALAPPVRAERAA